MSRFNYRISHSSIVVAACVFLSSEAISQDETRGSPARSAPKQDQEKAPTPPPLLEQDEDALTDLLIDFERLEGGIRVGFIAFSEDFESKPQPAGSLMLRGPSPWLSRSVLGLAEDDAGVFLELTFSRIDRDLEASFDHTDGSTFFAGAGVDYRLAKDETWGATAQLGLQYGSFGNVDETEDGIALLIGLSAKYRISPGIGATFSPQVAFSDAGDRLYFFQFGVRLAF